MQHIPRLTSPAVENDIPIRRGLRSDLLAFWGKSFQDLAQILDLADGIEGFLNWGAADEVMERFAGGEIILHQELAYNIQFAITEIVDDYWASYLCLLNGFTKQSQQLLRNTLELTVQMYFLLHLSREGVPCDSWTDSERGIERIPDKLKMIRKSLETGSKGSSSRLRRLYNTLCMATHSHKHRMAAIHSPRIYGSSDKPSFDPAEFVYSRAVFLSVLELELTLILIVLGSWNAHGVREQIQQTLSTMLERVGRYRKVIDNFDKGYLIRREYAVLSDGLKVLYSLRSTGEFEFPARHQTLTAAQVKMFRKHVELRLLQD